MHVAINCRSFLKKQYTGIGRYAHHLVQSLTEIDQHNEYSLYVQRKLFDSKRQIPQFSAKNFHVKIDRFNRGPEKTLKSIDLYHAPSPEVIKVKGPKVVATIHDLIYKTFPEGHTQATIDATDDQINSIVEHADKIICISQATMNDLLRYFDVKKEKVSLIYHGVDRETFFPIDESEARMFKKVIRSHGVDGDYLFFVGTLEPRKNLTNLLKAFATLINQKKFRGHLVIAGMPGWKNEDINDMIEKLGIQKETVLLGYLTNPELRMFYNYATAFVFPSFYEGFGFPILEAFACGTPVVTSNVSSCPEIAGEAALTIDPSSSDEIAEAVLKIANDRRLRESLVDKGLKRVEDFSFRNTAEETLQVYKEVCKRGI